MRLGATVLPILVALALGASSALAAPALDGTYAVSDTPYKIVAGSDGNVWVVLGGNPAQLARFTPAGGKTEFPLAGVTGAKGITTGPDGNLWVTASGAVVKVPPTNPSGFVATPLVNLTDPRGITVGPDGNLWTASADKVFRIPPGTPATATEFPVSGMGARDIAAAGGLLWVDDFGGQRVVKVTTQGSPTFLNVGGGPQGIASAPDGTVLFSNPTAVPQTIGRIAPGGQPVTTNVPGTDPFGIAFGPDGNFWVAQFATGKVARVAADGTVSTPVTVSGANDPREIAAGPNNTLWVSLELSKKVARITGVDPPPAPVTPTPTTPTGGGLPPDTAPPVLSALGVAPAAFRLGAGGPAVLAAAKRPPATIRLRLSEPATVRLSAERLLTGRRTGSGRCVKPARANRGRPRCVRAVVQGGTVPLALPGGAIRLRFAGRLVRALAPGSYRLVAIPTDAAGNRGAAKRASFTVLAPKRR